MGRQPLNSRTDPDHDPDPGILTEFLPLRNISICKNFTGSVALADASSFVRYFSSSV